MKLLEGIVGQNCSVSLLRNLEDERIASSDRAGRGHDDLASVVRFLERLTFRGINSMGKRCVDDHCDLPVRIFGLHCANSFVQLRKAWKRSTLCRDV